VWNKGAIGLYLIFLVSTVLITPRLYSGDEIQYFAFLRSAWKDHDLQFRNEYQWLVDRAPEKQQNFKKAFLDYTTPTGHARNDAPIGCAILWAPFFGLADLYAKATGAYPADGFSFPYILMICVASSLYGFLGFLLQFAIARKYFSPWVSFWAVLSLWFGAHAVYYMYVTPPMSHATSIFTTSLFLFSWWKIREKDTAGSWILLGLIGGIASLVRWQDAAFLLIPLLDRKPVRNKLLFAAAALVVFLPQLWVWKILNGEFNPYATGNLKGKFFWYGKYFLPVLFSSYHGLLLWTPVIGLCLIGLYPLLRTDRIFRLPVLIFLIQFYLVICADTWQGGAGFGLRYLISCTAIFTLGLAALYARCPRKVVTAVSIFFIVWNLFMVVQVAMGMLPRDGHFPVSTMVYNQFVEVPRRIGGIAYRYLFNRSSFYSNAQKK
jgi:hypothetical protein